MMGLQKLGLSLVVITLLPASVQASQFTPTEAELWERLDKREPRPAFSGKISLKVFRTQNLAKEVSAVVNYASSEQYSFDFAAPELGQMRLTASNGIVSALLPQDKVGFTQIVSPLPTAMFWPDLSRRPDLLKRNYQVRVLSFGYVAGRQAFEVEFVTKHKVRLNNYESIAATPRRRLWLDSENLQVLKMTGYWDAVNSDGSWYFSQQPYLETGFEQYLPTGSMPAALPQESWAIRLSEASEKSKISYASVAAARADHGNGLVHESNKLPQGFMLEDVQVYPLKTSPPNLIQVMNYTDGLSRVTTIISPYGEELVGHWGFQLALHAGKFGALANFTPYNYDFKGSPQRAITSVGDVAPTELERMNLSVSL